MLAGKRLGQPLALLVAAGIAVPVANAGAQYFPLDQPDESPAWWTLDDGVAPATLRDALRDAEKSRERLRLAVAAGRQAPLSEEQMSALVFFHDPAADPQLEPMWHAFHFFANYWLAEDGRLASASGLFRFGVSAAGAEIVLERAGAEARQFEELVEELGPAQKEYLQLARSAMSRSGADSAAVARIREAVKRRDAVGFAEATGAPLAVARHLAAAAGRDPALEAGVAALPALRSDLSEGDWQSLRRFLKDQATRRLAPISDFEAK